MFIQTNYFKCVVLVTINFNDFYIFINPTILLVGLWWFFFKTNTVLVKTATKNITNFSIIKINSNVVFV